MKFNLETEAVKTQLVQTIELNMQEKFGFWIRAKL